MRIIFAGGGTAGHINPALAVASYIKEIEPDSEILYVGAQEGMEKKLVPQAGFNFKGITISGFSRKISLKSLKNNLLTLKRIFTASIESNKIIKDFKPDICMGTGGYVSGPLLKEAARQQIPFVIHEQNAYPGITTKLLAKKASRVMLANKAAKEHIKTNKTIVVTGNPVRKGIELTDKNECRRKLGFDDKPLILSFGGSLGARKINEAVAELISSSEKTKSFNHIHAYGQYGKWFLDLIKEKGVNLDDNPRLDIREYIDNMPVCLGAADIVICRAGAITLSELEVCGKPAILIPSPNVAENHQYHNAMVLVKAGAADIIEEKALDGKVLIEKVSRLLGSRSKMKEYSENMRSLAVTDSCERIYKIIKEVLNEKK